MVGSELGYCIRVERYVYMHFRPKSINFKEKPGNYVPQMYILYPQFYFNNNDHRGWSTPLWTYFRKETTDGHSKEGVF